MKTSRVSVLLFAATVLLFACGKYKKHDPVASTAQVNMHLTDGPSIYDHVYLNIKLVGIKMEGDNFSYYPIARPGIYDILQFRNGADTFLAGLTLPGGVLEQVRLVLDPGNTVVVNGVTYPLNTPSAEESGVKMNMKQGIAVAGNYDIWLDFDAAKSIVATGSGSYNLKPVIRAYNAASNGRIKGYVIPLNAMATVYAINGNDTFSAIPDGTTGYFKISGLPDATYKLWVNPGILTLQAYVKNSVTVGYGQEVDEGTITLTP